MATPKPNELFISRVKTLAIQLEYFRARDIVADAVIIDEYPNLNSRRVVVTRQLIALEKQGFIRRDENNWGWWSLVV